MSFKSLFLESNDSAELIMNFKRKVVFPMAKKKKYSGQLVWIFLSNTKIKPSKCLSEKQFRDLVPMKIEGAKYKYAMGYFADSGMWNKDHWENETKCSNLTKFDAVVVPQSNGTFMIGKDLDKLSEWDYIF